MSDVLVLLHTAIAIIAVVLLIVVFRISALIALVIGSIYLGLAAGLGFESTTQTIVQGFGDVMAEIGLLIAFGVLLGSLMSAMGTLQRLVEVLLRFFGRRGSPYALGLSTGVVFPSIYADVLLILASPLARSLAPRMGAGGIAAPATAVTTGIVVGTTLVIPGVGTLALAGLLEVPLGMMLIYGLLVAIPTVALTMFIYGRLLHHGLWDEEKDEEEYAEAKEGTPAVAEQETGKLPPLYVSLLPIIVALLLIAVGSIATNTAGLKSGAIAFFGDPLVALFLGLLGAYLLAWRTLSAERVGTAIREGFGRSGEILILSGVGGSLAAVIGEAGLKDILGGYFSAGALTPLLLAWLIGALLHIALGSASIAAITAAGILAPVVGDLEVSTVLIALAAGSGALFGGHVNANFFWMVKALMGLSTRGTFKTFTLGESMASVISLLLILALSLVL